MRVVYPVAAITPNLLTAISAAIAAAAVVAFAVGDLVAGALLFQASFIVDCMDGKLAYTRDQRSRFGGFYDVAADTLRFGGCVGALAYAAAPTGSHAAIWTALIALYPATHFGVIVAGSAWPDRSAASPSRLPPRRSRCCGRRPAGWRSRARPSTRRPSPSRSAR